MSELTPKANGKGIWTRISLDQTAIATLNDRANGKLETF